MYIYLYVYIHVCLYMFRRYIRQCRCADQIAHVCLCVLVYVYLYMYVSWLPGICGSSAATTVFTREEGDKKHRHLKTDTKTHRCTDTPIYRNTDTLRQRHTERKREREHASKRERESERESERAKDKDIAKHIIENGRTLLGVCCSVLHCVVVCFSIL